MQLLKLKHNKKLEIDCFDEVNPESDPFTKTKTETLHFKLLATFQKRLSNYDRAGQLDSQR